MENLFVTKHKRFNVRQLRFISVKDRYITDKEYQIADVIKLWNEILTISEDSIPMIYIKEDGETRKDVVIKGHEFIYLLNNPHNIYVNVTSCELKETHESEEDILFDMQVIEKYILDYIRVKENEFEKDFNYTARHSELDKDFYNNRTAINNLAHEKDVFCKSYIYKLRSMLSVIYEMRVIIIDLY